MRKKALIFTLFIAMSCFSQNKQILYNFTSIPQSMMTNPGSDVKYKWYFGVPLLSGVSANVGSSGFSAYDLFADNGVDFNDKLRNVLFSTTKKDRVAVNEQIELFSGGFRIGPDEKKAYISFGMYQEFDMLSYMPKDIAVLAIDGNKDYGYVLEYCGFNNNSYRFSISLYLNFAFLFLIIISANSIT